MKVLIFGGTGLLGSQIALRLQANGETVRCVNRKISPNLKVDQYLGDIFRRSSYRDLVSSWEPDIVVQCAWITDQESYRNDPSNRLYAQNTIDLAEHCFRSNTKHFFGLGSSAEYGTPEKPCNAATSKPDPQDLYSEEKVRTNEGLRELAEKYSRRLTWGRVFQPYGRQQDPARLIPLAARKLTANEEITINNPNTVLDWISSRDVASAVSYALNHELPEVIDIGTSVGISIIDVLHEVAKLVAADPTLIHYKSPNRIEGTTQQLVVSEDSPLLQNGWRPQDNLSEGLAWALSV